MNDITKPAVLRWDDGVYAGDNRRLAMCGLIAVGAVFVPNGRGRFFRWRIWCSSRFYPCEGTERSESAAKQEVEKRFADFLELAHLTPREAT